MLHTFFCSHIWGENVDTTRVRVFIVHNAALSAHSTVHRIVFFYTNQILENQCQYYFQQSTPYLSGLYDLKSFYWQSSEIFSYSQAVTN